MTLDEIFHQLATAHDIPKAAVRAAVQQADALVPDVLRLMDLASRNVMLTRPEERLLFYGVHALAAARRTELYEPLLRLTAERSYEMGWLVGEAGLNALLISSYAPGSRLPYELLENPHIHDETRSELFLLMAWLVWQGHASREDFVAFLDRIDRDESIDPDDFAWFGWQSAVVLLGLTEFEERMRAGWQAGRMRFDRDVDHGDWISQLHQAARDPADGSNFSQFFAEPISDVFAALRKIPFFGFGRFRQQDVPDPADPARDIRLITDELQWLDRFLTSEIVPPDAMVLECLDGLVTALAIGPQEVPRDEWWPLVWSESGKEMPEFTGDVPESYVRQLIDRHFKTIQMRLNAGYRHVPLIEEDSPLEDAEAWADGFSVGADLRADSWQVIGKHKDAGLAMAAIAMLTPSEQIRAHEGWPAPLGEAERCAIVARLPNFIRAIYACWRGLPVQPLFEPRRSQKIGRNEPCPCGSSRKYKKCCGANAPG